MLKKTICDSKMKNFDKYDCGEIELFQAPQELFPKAGRHVQDDDRGTETIRHCEKNLFCTKY